MIERLTSPIHIVAELGTITLASKMEVHVRLVETDAPRRMLQLVHRTPGGRLLGLLATEPSAIPQLARHLEHAEYHARALGWLPRLVVNDPESHAESVLTPKEA